MPKFDRYEISQVAEYVDGIGNKFCEPLHGQTLESAKKDAGFVCSFWSLYGHLPGQGVECICDRSTQDDCVDLYKKITGDDALTGVDIYP